jgi:hypothetical protein
MKDRGSLRLSMSLALLLAGLAGCGSSAPAGGTAGSGGAGGGGRGGGAPTGSGGTGGGAPTSSGGSGGAPAGSDAASPGTSDAATGPLTTYQTCRPEQRVGDFELVLGKGFTGLLAASILDAVDPNFLPRTDKEIGACQVVLPPLPVRPCSPECAISQICTAAGCRPRPTAQNVGPMSIDGLKVPGTLVSNGNVYTNPPDPWPDPAFDEGAALVLRAAGAGAHPAFSARGWGVGRLQTPTDKLVVENGKPVTLTWTPPVKAGPTRVHISFAINRHGSLDAAVECEVPDTGSFTLEAAVITELFKHGISGFPSVDLKRQSSDTVTVPTGCVEFNVAATVNREISIPGLISCSGEEPQPGQPPECPPGQMCGDDLRCQ